MIRRSCVVLALVGALIAASAAPAAAAPTTDVVQGRILRIVSVADWEAAGSLLPGDSLLWDLAVSADTSDPGTVTISASADGTAQLVADVEMCRQPWEGADCAGGAVSVRSNWAIPLGSVNVDLVEMKHTDTAHLRLSLALAPEGEGGSTSIRIHARGEGDDVSIGSGGPLAETGNPSVTPLVVGGLGLVVLGTLLSARSIRRAATDPRGGGGA